MLIYSSLIVISALFGYRILHNRKKKRIKTKTIHDIYEIPEISELSDLIKKSVASGYYEQADQAYRNLILTAKQANIRHDGKYDIDLKGIKIEYCTFKTKYKKENDQEDCVDECKEGKLINKQIEDQAKHLSIEAYKVKGQDINESIRLMQSALRLNPNFEDRLKLANYLYQAGRRDESYRLYERLLKEIKPDDIYTYHLNIAEICEKVSIKKLNERDLIGFLKSHFLLTYAQVLSFACRGNIAAVEDFYNYHPKIRFACESRYKRFYKYINTEQKQLFPEIIDGYFATHENTIKRIAEIADTAFKSSRKNPKERIKAFNRNVMRNRSFESLYRKVGKQNFEKYRDQHIRKVYTFL